MKELWIFLLAILILTGLVVIPFEIRRRRALKIYWVRSCTGRDWRKAFPDADVEEFRKFLQVFVDAFAFRNNTRLKFRPSDRIIDIYRACYPIEGYLDSLELESFAMKVQKLYKVDIEASWNPEMSLGQIFGMAAKRGTLISS